MLETFWRLRSVILSILSNSPLFSGIFAQEPETKPETKAEAAPEQVAPNIIDKKLGLSYCGNDEGLYRDILKTYLATDKSGPLNAAFGEWDMKQYIVNIHYKHFLRSNSRHNITSISIIA